MSPRKMRKCTLHLDKALEPIEGDEKIGSGRQEKRVIIRSVPDFEEKLALMLKLSGTPEFQRVIQEPFTQWWAEKDCGENAKKARDFFYRRYKIPLRIQEGGVEVHSLPMTTGRELFELVAGRLRGKLGDETDETYEWPIIGYGFIGWHLYWLGAMLADDCMSDVCVNRDVVWHETEWEMRGELWLHFYDLDYIPSVTATVDFTANKEVKIRASLNVLPEIISPLDRVDERWRVKQIQLSGVDISAKELGQRLGLKISPGITKKKTFLTKSLVTQVRSAISRLDCLLKDRWEEIYSSCQEASARIKQHFS